MEYGPEYRNQPAGAGPPAKRKSTWAVVLAVLAGLVLVAGACATVTIFVAGQYFGQRRQAVRRADEAYQSAARSIRQGEEPLRTVDLKSGKVELNAKRAADTTQKRSAEARDSLAAARASLGQLPDGDAKDAYARSLDAMAVVLGKLENAEDYTRLAGRMERLYHAGVDTDLKARDDYNSAVEAANKKKDYGAMKTGAQRASREFSSAESFYRQAQDCDARAGIDKDVAYVTKRRTQADLAAEMGVDGAAGRWSQFDRKVKRVNQLGEEAKRIPDSAIQQDEDWTKKRVLEALAPVDVALKSSEALHARAMRRFGY